MDEIKFLYILKSGEQPDFDGRIHFVDVQVGEVHIVNNGSVLCGEDKERLKKEFKTKNIRVVKLRPNGVLCEKCEKKYKANGRLAWQKWVKNVQER